MIGIISVILLVGALALWIWPSQASWYVPFWSACCRLGPFMAVLWVAYPEVRRMPAWLVAAIPLLIVLLAVRPKLFLIALPVVIALAILRPRARPGR
jgi:hypothetical protein